MDLKAIQAYLTEQKLDGWLLADFHGRNGIAMSLLGIDGMITRRSFYFIPASGTPKGLVHNIEKAKFLHVPGELTTFSAYTLLEQELQHLLQGVKRVAMEYSPNARLPYIGLVDAGTIELVRSLGVEVISSADLVAYFQARLSVEQIATHRIAARNLIEIKTKAFAFIAAALKEGKTITEWDIMQYMRDLFTSYEMTSDSGPICAVDAHAGDPHYEPMADFSAPIKKGQLILLDLWAKLTVPNAAYADITWMGYSGTAADIPTSHAEKFAVIAAARDAAVAYVRQQYGKEPVFGFQVDDASRQSIRTAGLGQYFVHRTGHSITHQEHGSGPNIDNLETEDRRQLQPGHLFSVEPGVYYPDCGFRTEINVLITPEGPEITTLPLQGTISALF